METVHLEGARQVTLSGLGHIGLLTDRSVGLQVARGSSTPSWGSEQKRAPVPEALAS